MAEEKKVEETKKDMPELSKDAQKVLEIVEKMSVLELADLVKVMEEKFGVSAAAPVAVAAVAGGAGAEEPAEEKTAFDVVLADAGSNKINVIKAVKEIMEIGLKEAKDLVESAPKPVKEGVSKEVAEEIKAKLEEAGAKVEVK